MDLLKLITEQNESEEDVSKEVMELFEMGIPNDKKEAFNSALANAAKDLVSKHSLARKVLCARKVGPGTVVRYDRDGTSVSFCSDENTPENVSAITEGRYVWPIEVEVSAKIFLPKVINGKNLYAAFMNMVSELITQEDNYVVKLLRKSAIRNNFVTHYPIGPDPTQFIQYVKNQFGKLEKEDVDIASVIVNREFTDYCNNGFKSEKGSFFGNMGTMDRRNEDLPVYSTSSLSRCTLLKPGEILVVAKSEYLGGMPIRIDFMSEAFAQESKGWFFYELISMVVVNGKFVVLVV